MASEAFQRYPSFHLESSFFGFGFSLPCLFRDDSVGAFLVNYLVGRVLVLYLAVAFSV